MQLYHGTISSRPHLLLLVTSWEPQAELAGPCSLLIVFVRNYQCTTVGSWGKKVGRMHNDNSPVMSSVHFTFSKCSTSILELLRLISGFYLLSLLKYASSAVGLCMQHTIKRNNKDYRLIAWPSELERDACSLSSQGRFPQHSANQIYFGNWFVPTDAIPGPLVCLRQLGTACAVFSHPLVSQTWLNNNKNKMQSNCQGHPLSALSEPPPPFFSIITFGIYTPAGYWLIRFSVRNVIQG